MNEQTKEWSRKILNVASEKIDAELDRMGNKIPYISYNGKYTDVIKDRGIDWWTNGFWSGILWRLFHKTKREKFKEAAIQQEQLLESALYHFSDVHHDVGFLFLPSAIAHYQQSQNKHSRQLGLHAATVLAGRYNISGNYLVAWNDHKPGWMIIDSMMNLPLLYWASRETGDPRFSKIAQRHADTTAKYLVRKDGSTGHIAEFDAESGKYIRLLGGQGYNENSCWSRGNAWALYGFALSYRYTKNPYYLAIAEKIAVNFIQKIEKTGYIPLIDFAVKDSNIDTSAGVCGACGLLELAGYVSSVRSKMYHEVAINILQKTEKHYANWNMDEDGIIGGGAEAYHRELTYNVPLIYSDYFFIEGLLRLEQSELAIW